jgi:AraC-like DNA-binding protein
MISQSFLPCPALRDYVQIYHVRHFVFDGKSPIPFKPFPPRAEHCIEFYPRQPEITENISDHQKNQRTSSSIKGQYTARINRHILQDFLYIGVTLLPGALFRLTNIPLFELNNTFVDAEIVFGTEIKQVNQRLNSTGSYDEMIQIIESFLLMLVGKVKTKEHAVDAVAKIILHHPENLSLDWLSGQACLCPRQFERKFKERIGICPKTFARIARMHNTYKMHYLHPGEDWLSIALACGYHDYQHLVRDYKEFANTTPTALFQADDKAPERYLGMVETFSADKTKSGFHQLTV